MIKSVRSASVVVLGSWYLIRLKLTSYLLSGTEIQNEPRAYPSRQDSNRG